MELPLINLLIRTSSRPAAFTRCLSSIQQQTYSNYRIIVSYDNDEAVNYIRSDLFKIRVLMVSNFPFYYDLYCNNLKTLITDGWFFFLDDDDTLASPTAIEQLSQHLTGPHEAIICQMLRNGVAKPRDNYIRSKVIAEGKIGLPCLVLHSKHKHLSGLDGYKAGDYRYIKDVISQVPTKFITLPVVNAGSRSHGQMEDNTQLSENSI